MSAIGDYVHLTARGYINPKYANKSEEITPTYFSQAQQIFTTRQAALDKYFSNTQYKPLAKTLEMKMNEILSLFQKSDLSKEEQELVDSILKDMAQQLDDKFTGIKFTRSLEKGASILGNTRQIKINENHSYQQIVDQVNNLLAKIGNRLKSFQGGKKAEALKVAIADAQKSFDQILKTISQEIDKMMQQSQGLTQRGLAKKKKELLLSQLENTKIINVINNIIASLKVSNNAEFIGAVGEYFTEAITDLLIGTSVDAVGNTIASASQTGNLSKESGYYIESFPVWTDWKKVLDTKSEIQISNGNFIATMTSGIVKDKADIVITASNKEKIGVSVKNYSEYFAQEFGIKITSSSPFLSLIQNENNDNFINHYLNLRVAHNTTKIADSQSYVAVLSKQAQQADTIMRQLIMQKTFTNKNVVGSMNNADIFVYIERPGRGKQPRAYVRAMPELIKKVFEQNTSLRLPTAIPNHFESSGYQSRINGIFAYLHKYKILFSFNPEIIKSQI